MGRWRTRQLRILLAGSAALIALHGVAHAQAGQISLPEQPLALSLRSIAQATGRNVLFTPEAVEGLRAPALSGTMDAGEAIAQLIRGMDLEVISDGAAGLIVRHKIHAAAPAPDITDAPLMLPPEAIVVTGSRLIFNNLESPTPVASLPQSQLRANTPSNLPDALNKLPVFQGSTTPRGTNNASVNAAGNVLNLRNFGGQRTLVLLDGHRVAASNANGTVDIDTLPQMLIQRVEIATGGASAVYGSDAVTGVVNFILDKQFTGVKVEINSGLSGYGDGASHTIGLAAGTALWSGRGHVEIALRRFYQDGINHNERPEGRDYWLLTGAGTAANPFVSTRNARLTRFGGIITCAGCAANNMRFNAVGGVSPYNYGTPTGTTGVSSGGDGGYSSIAQITSSLGTGEAFGRFSYNLDDSMVFYAQASAAESRNKGSFQNHAFQTNAVANTLAVPNTFLKTNPFMPAALAPLFAGSQPSFQVAGYFDMGYPRSGNQSNALQRSLHFDTGVEGTLNGYAWDVYYLHGESRLHESNPANVNYQRMYAAMDAVPGPTPGSVVCRVSTTAFASLFPGCVPLNPFGANAVGMSAITREANDYISGDTSWWLTQVTDNIGGNVSGELFDLPAGAVKAALSGEMRWLSLDIQSNASPTATVDCTGLRTSVPGAPDYALCNPATALWQNNTVAALPEVRESVWDLAGELSVPLLKDMAPLGSLNLNLAGRYTDYSTSGPVQTWKIGLDWRISDAVNLRATNSVDIRAPTLFDLRARINQGIQSFSDALHTGVTGQNFAVSQGNVALVPEVARTYTAGVVLKPGFAPNFTASLDYYSIVLKNAITNLTGGNITIQKLCEDSGGASPYCGLIVRPLPFADRSATNFPTQILSQPVNAAFNKLEGLDIELNYSFDLASVNDAWGGAVTLRALGNVQPVNQAIQYAGAPLTFTAYPHSRITLMAGYTKDDWMFNLLDRWISGFGKATQFGQVYAQPRVASINYVDLNISRRFQIEDGVLEAYLSVQNVLDQRPRLNPTNSTNPGLYFMGVQGTTTSLYDAIGRYFTLGVKAEF